MNLSRSSRHTLALLATMTLLTFIGAPARAGVAQQIDFPELYPIAIQEFQYLEPTASSGLPVTVSIQTPQTCTYEAPYLTAVKSGTCEVRASQPGNAQFDPASPVTRSVMVDKQPSRLLPDAPEFVYEPDETIVLSGVVNAQRPREDDPVPTGKVTITVQPFSGDDSWTLNAPLDAAGGFRVEFNQPPIPLKPQSYGILYSYSGDDYFDAGYDEDVIPFDVASKTETQLTVTPKSAPWGDTFTFSAKVVDAKSGKVPDDLVGDVNFRWTGGQASAALVDGIAEMRTTRMAPGTNTVVAQYVDTEQNHRYGTSYDKKDVSATGLDPYVGYADGTGAVGVPLQPLYPIMRGFDQPEFSAKDLPQGLSIDESTGVIAGTPAVAGRSSVTVTVQDAENEGQATLSILVVKSDVTPAIAYPLAKAQVGKPMKPLTPHITGLSRPFVVSVADLPTGLKMDAATGVISGTPAQIGVFTPSVTAVGKQGTATTKATIELTAAPVPAHVSYPTVQGVAGSPLEPVTPFTEGLSGALTYEASGLPRGLTIDKRTGLVSGTPTTAATTTVAASVKGAEGTAKTTFTVTISATPLPKTLSYAKIKGQQYQPITPAVPQVTGLAGGLTFTAKGLPKGLKLNPSTGIIKGVPKVSGKKVATVTAIGRNGKAKDKVVMRFAKNPGHLPRVPLAVKGARPASDKLPARTTTRLIASATSPGDVSAHITCSFGEDAGAVSLCNTRVAKTTLRATVNPRCSVPRMTVTLLVSAHPTKKQSTKYNPHSWTRTWKVGGGTGVPCISTGR